MGGEAKTEAEAEAETNAMHFLRHGHGKQRERVEGVREEDGPRRLRAMDMRGVCWL